MSLHLIKLFRLSILLALTVFAVPCAAFERSLPGNAQAGPSSESREHEIAAIYRIAGQPSGSYHEAVTPEAQGTATAIESDLVFNRMGSKLEMKTSSSYREDAAGHLAEIAVDTSSSQQSTHVDVRVDGSSVQIKSTTGEKTYESHVPLSGTLAGPNAARKLILSGLHKPGDRVSYETFSPELGSVVTVTVTFVGKEDLAVEGELFKSLKLEQTMTGLPMKTSLWIDSEGWLLRQLLPSPVGDIEAVRTRSSPTALANIGGASLPSETFSGSIVRANVRLPKERLIERMRVKITHRQPELGWPDFRADNQRLIEKTPNYVVLEIERLDPKSRATRPMPGSGAMEPYLSANALLQSDEAEIKRIAESVVGSEHDAWRAARALQQWTNDNMHFDLGIAIAPASELARNRRGTCFGYSIMLGALARAAGIPSRVRMGYVYAGGIWGGHAWVDVRIGDEWISLDGALYSPGAADAARFSFLTSSLEEGALAGLGSLQQLFGHVDIEILQYTVAGESIDVPKSAKPYTITNNMYCNPWLGLSLAKPASFRYSGLDLTWPENTVIAMDGPHQERIEVKSLATSLPTETLNEGKYLEDAGLTGARSYSKVSGHTAMTVSSEEKAGTVLVENGAVWLFTATGPQAPKLLEQVVSSVVLKD
ncbi:MAG: transglutaminase domain-containing protein [Acidobacteriaceae bacterium]|nr:transglutaminase domain-containing protein [Acidobacteriaceae bacterium]MBV9781388.1 transglutaminase domain-containing protein [Acidobacteriaceae bacterium]